MMKLILVEQTPNILINYRTLKLLYFLTICWDCIHLSIVGYVYVSMCVCVCVCVCFARARVRGKLEVSQINSGNSRTVLDKRVKIKLCCAWL